MSKNRNTNYRKQLGLLVAGVAIVAIGALVLSGGKTALSNSKKVQVVAGENFWGNIASQIGGNKVRVTSIITDPNADPHLYESDARDAVAIASADVVVENGVGYDDFMSKLLAASPSTHRTVLTAATILNATGEDANPHLWYDTPRVPLVAAQMEDAMSAKDPDDKAMFEKNLQLFDASLNPILNVLANIKANYPGAPVAYTERVPGYLLANAGLTVETPPGFASAVEDGNDPGPADTLAMDNLMTNHGVKVLLYNAQTTSSVTQHVRDLANAAGIPVVGVTETLPANEKTFQSWQFDQANALLKALGGK